MVDVFSDFEYSLRYEQYEVDSFGSYKNYAKSLVNLSLPKIPTNSFGLDLGCGTGILTCELFDKIEGVTILGVDKSQAYLNLALLKFGLLDNETEDFIFREILKEGYYYPLIKQEFGIKNLSFYLKSLQTKYKKFKDNINFYNRDASNLSDLPLVDFVIASQFIHWLRKKDGSLDNPNLDYERQVLQGVRDRLKENGLFCFNTSGWDFKFSDDSMNEKHRINHPFYESFRKNLGNLLGSEYKKPEKFTFDYNEIKKIINENGFEILDSTESSYKLGPNVLVESCLIGAHMEVFQKKNIEASAEERENLIRDALQTTYDTCKYSLFSNEINEVGVHFVTRKV